LRHVLPFFMILESLPFFTQSPIARNRYYQGVRMAYSIEGICLLLQLGPFPSQSALSELLLIKMRIRKSPSAG
jgi:hypothetical protein